MEAAKKKTAVNATIDDSNKDQPSSGEAAGGAAVASGRTDGAERGIDKAENPAE